MLLGPWKYVRPGAGFRRVVEEAARLAFSKPVAYGCGGLMRIVEEYRRKAFGHVEHHFAVAEASLAGLLPRLNIHRSLGGEALAALVVDVEASGHVLEVEYARDVGVPVLLIRGWDRGECLVVTFANFDQVRGRLSGARVFLSTGMLSDFVGSLFASLLVPIWVLRRALEGDAGVVEEFARCLCGGLSGLFDQVLRRVDIAEAFSRASQSTRL